MTGGAGDLWFVSSLRIPSTLPKARVQSRIDGQNITSLTKSWILRTWPDFSEIFWPWVCWVCTIPVWNNSNNWNAIQVEKYWWDPESSNFSSAAAASETPSWKDRWLAMPRKHSPSSKRRFVSRGPMKNQDIHGSGDLHRSFPGGLYYIGIFWIDFCHLAAFCMLLPRQWNGHKNTLSRNFFRHKPPATSPSISRVRGANVTPVGPLAEHGMTWPVEIIGIWYYMMVY